MRLAACFLVVLVGCERAAPTPVAVDAAFVVMAPVVAAPGAVAAEPPRPVPDAAAPQVEAGATAVPEPVGGPWVTCYAHFRPSATPPRDVQRLGLLCGPSNGMRRVGETLEGTATAGGAEHAFDAKSGECFRIFAVAEPSVGDLGVALRDPRGDELAADHGDDRWPIVNPDGPVCVKDDGRYSLLVRAQKGAGAYALQIWKLPVR